MTVRTVLLANVAVVGVALAGWGQPSGRQQPQFRTAVDAVSVDVLVLDGNVPVPGLGLADFELLDNGVRQTIGVVSMSSVPIDVSLLLDTSFSVRGELERLTADLAAIGALLQPADRLEVLAFASDVRYVLPLGQRPDTPILSLANLGQATSLYDALATALMQRPHLNRRRLVAVLTDGGDTMSAVGLRTVRELARRSTFNIQIALVTTNQPSSGGFRQWVPFAGRDVEGLTEVATLTGGLAHRFDEQPAADRVAVFRDILDRFRSSYVVTFVPTGVEPHGWHELSVTVRSRPDATIRARKGYILN
jgi:VWFA-related protein